MHFWATERSSVLSFVVQHPYINYPSRISHDGFVLTDHSPGLPALQVTEQRYRWKWVFSIQCLSLYTALWLLSNYWNQFLLNAANPICELLILFSDQAQLYFQSCGNCFVFGIGNQPYKIKKCFMAFGWNDSIFAEQATSLVHHAGSTLNTKISHAVQTLNFLLSRCFDRDWWKSVSSYLCIDACNLFVACCRMFDQRLCFIPRRLSARV